MSNQWTLWADRAIGGAPLGPVQAVSAKFTQLMNGFGTGSVTIDVEQVSLTADDMLAFWSWRLWFYYGTTLVWCGCPTGLVDNGTATVDITLTELPGYLSRRVYDRVGDYVQVEQMAIAANIAGPVTDIGVTVLTDPGTGVLRDRHYDYLEGESRAALLQNLSTVQNGPEFRAEYTQDAVTGAPACVLHIAYPRIGSAASGLGVMVPGNAVDVDATWDADEYRTRTYAVGELPEGAAAGAKKPVVIVDRPIGGVPRLDSVDDWPSVVVVSTLTERANTNATIYATPAVAVKGSVPVDDPPLPSYGVGDDVTINVVDPLMPAGWSTTGRLIARDVDCDAGTVAWTMTATQPPARPRKSLSRRLSTLDATAMELFRTRLDTTGAAP